METRSLMRTESRREELRERLDEWFEVPLIGAAIALIILLLVDVIHEPEPPWDQYIEWIGIGIWSIFALEFGARIWLSPNRIDYLKDHWLDAVAVALPPLRILRGVRALQVLVYSGRGAGEFMERLRQRRLGKLAVITFFVGLSGASLLYIAEVDNPDSPIQSFGDALYWTALAVMSGEGGLGFTNPGARLIELMMVAYSLVVFSYLIGAVASLWIESDHLAKVFTEEEQQVRQPEQPE